VEFTFDMREDTADCIAKEMMDDLSLSEDEAAKIAKKIKEEIGRLVGFLGGTGLWPWCAWGSTRTCRAALVPVFVETWAAAVRPSWVQQSAPLSIR
jgi:hypothetical protein